MQLCGMRDGAEPASGAEDHCEGEIEMNKRLEQLVDAMQPHRDRVARLWKLHLADLAFAKTIADGTCKKWAPVMTEQEKQEHEQYVKTNRLQF